MELLDFLFGGDGSSSKGDLDWDRSVFDSDRFRNNSSGNWVDLEYVSIGKYDGTDLNIRITMKMESSSHGIPFKPYDLQWMKAMGISRNELAANLQMTLEELDALLTPTRDYTISEIRHLLGGVYLDIRVEIVPE